MLLHLPGCSYSPSNPRPTTELSLALGTIQSCAFGSPSATPFARIDSIAAHPRKTDLVSVGARWRSPRDEASERSIHTASRAACRTA
ncbi:hypothetical protein CMUS01_01912 [Colletotrichum musicola]|uniref:Uncharacterized protein n=1 Tax=Colletotrichum musicola TaxID=2175873 RepID=A0A8H6U888_9PEZI|nr:hypothetical protein CMUS01_01912 [Colletotrichum musicola]